MNYYAALIKSKQEQKAPDFLNTIKGHYASLLREKYNYDPKQERGSDIRKTQKKHKMS